MCVLVMTIAVKGIVKSFCQLSLTYRHFIKPHRGSVYLLTDFGKVLWKGLYDNNTIMGIWINGINMNYMFIPKLYVQYIFLIQVNSRKGFGRCRLSCFYTIYTIYLSLCTQAAETTSPEPFSWITLYIYNFFFCRF